MTVLALLLDGAGTLFLRAVHTLTAHRFVEIDLEPVEFGAIDTGEDGLAAHRDAAGAAHARTIDHQRIERYDRRQGVLLGRERHELHHNHRTDGHADVVLLAPVVDQVFDQGRYHTFEAFAAVVGSDVEIVRYTGHLLGIDQHRLGLGTDDDIRFHPVFVKPFYLRIDRSRTHAARYKQEAFLAQGVEIFVNELRGVPQRTDEIGQRIALLQGAELAGRGSDSLRDDRYRALLGVVIGDGQGYSFAEFVDANDDELSGFAARATRGA